MGEECVQGFDGKASRKEPLGRPRRRWDNGIRMGLREIGWGSVDWIQLAQDRDRWRALVNTAMNLMVLAPWSLLVYCAKFSPELLLFSLGFIKFSYGKSHSM
jgi:hypothetical protein